MKRYFKVVLALAALVCLSGKTLFAQKYGFINSQELIAAMPERDSVATKLDALSKDLSETLDAIQVEFNNKLQDYQKGAATMSDAIKQMKDKELQDLQNRFEEQQQIAQQEMQKEQQRLMKPVIDRATAAVEKVSKAAGLIVVYDISSGALAYHDESMMTNILPLVKKELGIVEKSPAATATGTKK